MLERGVYIMQTVRWWHRHVSMFNMLHVSTIIWYIIILITMHYLCMYSVQVSSCYRSWALCSGHTKVHGHPVLYRQHQPSMAIGKSLSMPAYEIKTTWMVWCIIIKTHAIIPTQSWGKYGHNINGKVRVLYSSTLPWITTNRSMDRCIVNWWNQMHSVLHATCTCIYCYSWIYYNFCEVCISPWTIYYQLCFTTQEQWYIHDT